MAAPEPDSVTFCPATGKVRHPSYKVAVTNLHRVLRGYDGSGRDRKERGRLCVYRCEHCNGHHVGNNDPFIIKSRKRRRRRGRYEDYGEAA